jgi:type IV secretory pathway component VirB8
MFDIFHTIFKYKEKTSPDKLGLYPERAHVDALPERKYLWTSRVLVILSCITMAFSIMLASSLYLLVVQKRVKPRLLYINYNTQSLSRLGKFETVTPVSNVVAQMLISEYIKVRNEIPDDPDLIEERWGAYKKLYWLSTTLTYQQFLAKEAQSNYYLLKMKNIRRDVDIKWIREETRGLWIAEFVTTDFAPRKKPKPRIWRATMRVGFGPRPFRDKQDVMQNPFGFAVTMYSLSYVGIPTIEYLKSL